MRVSLWSIRFETRQTSQCCFLLCLSFASRRLECFAHPNRRGPQSTREFPQRRTVNVRRQKRWLVPLVAGLCDSLVLQNPDLDSPVFRAPGCCFVIGDGLGFTKSKGLNQPPQIQIMHANQVLYYGL